MEKRKEKDGGITEKKERWRKERREKEKDGRRMQRNA